MKPLHIREARWGEVWKAALVWALAAGAMVALDDQVDLANLAMLLLLASALAGLWLRAWVAMGASAAAVLAFNWAFVPPRHTLQVDLRRDALLLAVMLGVSWIVTVLMARLRDTAALAHEQAARAEQLRSLGDALRDADDPRTQAHRLHAALQALSRGTVRLLLLKAPPPVTDEPGVETWLGGDPDDEVRTGAWLCLRQQAAMGPGTGRHDEELDAWYLPLRGRGVAFGAAWIELGEDTARDAATRAQAQALCDQMGQALSRAHALASAHEAQARAQDQAVRNALLAAISHDFRTPLATIMGAASSLQAQDARLSVEQRHRLAETIVDEAGQLARLTDNTLQLARLDAPGGVTLSLDWESAEELVGAVLRRARRRDPARRLRARLEPGLPLLRCDAMLLTQLLDNLVDNALKYGDAAAPVELLVRRHGEQVVLAVRDRGPGVPPAWREKVFQVFRRGEATPRASTRPGVGVGLAVCRAIARAHGGELRLRPRGHGGTAFECWLPVAEQPAPASEAAA